MQSLVDVNLHQFKDIINSYASKIKLPESFPQFLDIVQKQVIGDAGPRQTEAAREATSLLFADAAAPLASITPDACVQPYGIGSCYFVAALAAQAKANPQKILDMIHVNDDGSYTVKFPGAAKPITVQKPTDAEIEQDGGKNKYGLWSLVMQKAYGKMWAEGTGKKDLDGADGGSMLSAGVRVLNEKGVPNAGIGEIIPMLNLQDIDSRLRDSVIPKDPRDALSVVASTAKIPFAKGDTSDGFVRGHVYSVLAYEPNAQDVSQGKVTVRNPWGGEGATRTITLKQFADNFFQLSIPVR